MTKSFALLLLLLPVLLAGIPDRGWRYMGNTYWYNPGLETDVQNSKAENFYTSPLNTQLDSTLYSHLDADLNQWLPNYSEVYTYAVGTDNIIELRGYGYDVTYALFSKVLASYDSWGRITSMISYSASDSPDFTNPSNLNYYFYDEQGIAEAYWHNTYSPIPDYYKTTYQKDERGRVLIAQNFRSPDSLYWLPTSRLLYTYHANDTSTGAEYTNYLSQSLNRGLYGGYNLFLLQGMITERIDQENVNDTWVNNFRYLLEYDASNRLINLIDQGISMGNWHNVLRYQYEYDANGNLSFRSTQQDSNSVWSAIYETFDYSWEQYTSNDDVIQPPITHTISAWPNPFRESINISLPDKSPFQLNIYNLKGQLVKSYAGEQRITWDGRDNHNKPVSAGMYFLRSGSGRQATLRKILKIN